MICFFILILRFHATNQFLDTILKSCPAQQIRFDSKLMLSDGSYILYADKLSENNGRLNLFNPSCFLFPEENNCLPGDTFKTFG